LIKLHSIAYRRRAINMTLQLSRKQFTILLLSIAVILGIAYLAYFLFVSPVNQKISQLENSLKTEQRLLELVSQKQATDEPIVSSTEVQKKLPVIPLVEQIILDIERAETLSESKVTSMSYSESEFVYTDSEDQVEETATENTTDTNQEVSNNENSSTEEGNAIDPELVDGLSLITDRKSTRLNSSHVKISYAVF